MTNPFHSTPVDTPAIVHEVTSALALWIFPSAFLLICFVMAISRTEKPPYFPVFCIFGSMGAFCLAILFANGPISILGFLIAFVASPILLVRNWFKLRASARNSMCHKMVRWASLVPLAILIFFVAWQPAEDKHQAEHGFAPNRSLPPSLKSEFRVHGSED